MSKDDRAGSRPDDEAGPLHGGPDDDYTPEQLATMDREDLNRLGARYDGVEVLHVLTVVWFPHEIESKSEIYGALGGALVLTRRGTLRADVTPV